MLKTGLNIARFKVHVPLIEDETEQYFKRWGQNGNKGKHSPHLLGLLFLQVFLESGPSMIII